MNKIQKIIILIASIFTHGLILNAQIDTVYSPFDYYNGGRNAFGRHICETIDYPADARFKGIDGLSVFSFKIDCNKGPYDITFLSTLGYGIEESITNVLKETKGNWINCEDLPIDSQFTIKLAFSLNSVYMPGQDEMDFIIIADIGDQRILTDEKLTKKVNDLNREGKYKKSKKYLMNLIRRYPFDKDYKRLLIAIDQKLKTNE